MQRLQTHKHSFEYTHWFFSICPLALLKSGRALFNGLIEKKSLPFIMEALSVDRLISSEHFFFHNCSLWSRISLQLVLWLWSALLDRLVVHLAVEQLVQLRLVRFAAFFHSRARWSWELTSSEAPPWLPRCAPTVHAERFIICELTMSPGAGWSGRRRRNRAALGTRSRGRLTGERASSTIAPESATRGGPARTHFATVGRSLAAERTQPLELVGAGWLVDGARLACRPPRRLPLQATRSGEPCSERCSSLDRTWHGLTVRAAARFTGGGSWGLISRNFVPLLTTLGWKIDLTLDGGSLTWIWHCLHPWRGIETPGSAKRIIDKKEDKVSIGNGRLVIHGDFYNCSPFLQNAMGPTRDAWYQYLGSLFLNKGWLFLGQKWQTCQWPKKV